MFTFARRNPSSSEQKQANYPLRAADLIDWSAQRAKRKTNQRPRDLAESAIIQSFPIKVDVALYLIKKTCLGVCAAGVEMRWTWFMQSTD